MATVPVPRTWTTSEVVTAAIMNGTTGVKGALDFLLGTTLPRTSVYQTATTSPASGTSTVILFDTEAYDTDAMHSTVTNTGRITATTTGLYLVTGTVVWAANATGTRTLELRKNGVTTVNRARIHSLVASDAPQTVTAYVQLTATDYVELVGTQTSGGALATVAGVGQTMFQASWVANS